MSARIRRHAQGQNLDSLLDTMANVTGILVVLLVVTQISVGDAMERLRDQLSARPELSRESLAAAASEAEQLRLALGSRSDDKESLEAERRERRAELASLRGELADGERKLTALRARPRSEADARDRVAAARGRALDLESALARERAAVTALERELAALPAPGPARDARLPDTRRAPPGAQPILFAVRHGRVLPMDPRRLVDALDSAVWRASGVMDSRALLTNPGLRARVMQFFSQRDVGDEDMRWRVVEEGDDLIGIVDWRRTDLGETQEQIASSDSAFQRAISQLDRRRTALQFYVWDDSFETYLAARKLADRRGLAAGWEPYAAQEPLRHYITRGTPRGVVVD